MLKLQNIQIFVLFQVLIEAALCVLELSVHLKLVGAAVRGHKFKNKYIHMYIHTTRYIMHYLLSRKHLLVLCRKKQVKTQTFSISGRMSPVY